MATADQISLRALKRLSVVASGENPDAETMADAVAALSAMMSAWEADGVEVTLPLDGRFEQAVVAMLAVRLSEDHGATAGPVLIRDATSGWQQIQAAYITPATPAFDAALTRTPSRRYSETMPISGTVPWKANTGFDLGILVSNSGNVYVCIVSGVSGPTGPSGTGNNQADGSCVWDFVEAIGG